MVVIRRSLSIVEDVIATFILLSYRLGRMKSADNGTINEPSQEC
jgi:hypothetical protein